MYLRAMFVIVLGVVALGLSGCARETGAWSVYAPGLSVGQCRYDLRAAEDVVVVLHWDVWIDGVRTASHACRARLDSSNRRRVIAAISEPTILNDDLRRDVSIEIGDVAAAGSYPPRLTGRLAGGHSESGPVQVGGRKRLIYYFELPESVLKIEGGDPLPSVEAVPFALELWAEFLLPT